LYEGNGTSQTITNNLDLDGKGGMVWIKSRPDTYGHRLIDTERGVNKVLESYDTTAEVTQTGSLTAFNSNGFDVGNAGHTNFSGNDFVSWSFLKKPGFFDVITYTGDGTSSRDIAHNLGIKPGFMLTKRLNSTGNWTGYHQSLGYTKRIYLDVTNAASTNAATWVQEPTATHFTVGSENTSGNTYVAYLFAHDAQVFGDNQDESIIKCGSYTGNGSTDGPEINLGWEPQWILIKNATTGGTGKNWQIYDSMRGFVTGGDDSYLLPNLTNAEGLFEAGDFLATGFKIRATDSSINGSGDTYIYISIRRPMKTPTAATEVFAPTAYTGTEPTPQYFTTGFTVDANIFKYRNAAIGSTISDRLRGGPIYSLTSDTSAEGDLTGNPDSAVFNVQFERNDGFSVGSGAANATNDVIAYSFKRAPSFFDVVAYSGDGGTTQTLNHNLGVTPEFMIAKRRNDTQNWVVYHSLVGAGKYYNLNTTSGASTLSTVWGGVAPTSTQFTVGNSTTVNFNGDSYITYLFATLAGISKVGSYTGTGSNVDVDCGFSAGARFILIKRSDSTGDWYVYDSARGIVAGNDPYFLLNSTAAEATGTDYIDPLSSGFTVTSSAPAGLNASGGSYIFLAIA